MKSETKKEREQSSERKEVVDLNKESFDYNLRVLRLPEREIRKLEEKGHVKEVF